MDTEKIYIDIWVDGKATLTSTPTINSLQYILVEDASTGTISKITKPNFISDLGLMTSANSLTSISLAGETSLSIVNNVITIPYTTISLPGIVKLGYTDNGPNIAIKSASNRLYTTLTHTAVMDVVAIEFNKKLDIPNGNTGQFIDGTGNLQNLPAAYVLPTATSTVLGGVRLFSNTVQTVAATAVSATASRTYGVQFNSSNQLVVNVPWVDTNTSYTAGTGLVLTGTTFSIAPAYLTNIANGQTAFSWGDHANAGYLKSIGVQDLSIYNDTTKLLDYNPIAQKDLVFKSGTGIVITSSSANTLTFGIDFVPNTGTLSSVGLNVPVGFTVTNSPLTSNGFIGLQYAPGYSLPTNVKQTQWDAAYSWGNHASAGYLTNVPIASATVLGLIRVGANLAIDSSGILSATTVVTRLRGTASGTYESGDITIQGGPNVTVSQSGKVITLSFDDTNTTYTSSNGILLTGTNFTPVYGTTANTIAQGNDSRIINGQTAFTWGNHSLAGYLTNVSNASSTTFGLVKLFSDTIQTVAATAVSATASRTYGVQINSSNQLVVNVPWSNTTYTAMSLAELNAGTVTTDRIISSVTLNDWIGGKGFLTSVDLTGYATEAWVQAQGYVTTDTVTRLRGTAAGTYTSGDLTLLAGTNITISQTGSNITINSNFTNTTYTAGNGLTLTGTVFSLPVSITGTGNYVTDVTQTASGITITKATLPTYTDTVTRLRGTTGGTFTSGDLTLLAGTNITITQSGANFTINSTSSNTTYTSSNGILLTGTNFTPVYGTAVNTIAQGNDSRIINGQTAFSWGNHATMGYLTSVDLAGYATETWVLSQGYVTTNTVTRLRGTATGTYTSGDLTLLAGTNITISQTGTDITINGSFTNTTYTAGNGLTLTGTVFSLPVTVSGSGNYVSDVTQTASGITITKATLPTYTNTVTRLRGTATGTYTSGDLTLLAGTNITISQSGTNFTINSNFTNTTYTAGAGLTLTGTVFSLPVTVSGSGNYVSSVTQNTNGVTVVMGTLPVYNNGTVTSVGMTIGGNALNTNTATITSSGTFGLTWAGTTAQYVNGQGNLVAFPTIPTVNNGTLTLATSADLTGSASFTANQSGNSTFTVGLSTTTSSNINLGVIAYGWGRGLRVDGNGAPSGAATWAGDIADVRNASMYASTSASGKPTVGNTDVTIVNFTSGIANIGGVNRYSGFDLVASVVTDQLFYRMEDMGPKKSWYEILTTSNISSFIPTVNNGTLTLATGTGLSGSATFTANQAGNSSFTVGIASGYTLPTTTQVNNWNTAYSWGNHASAGYSTTDTITRLRGTAAGTYTSGDLTLLAGTNVSISQSGANITISATNTNTTYTAGNGLTLSGTTFSLPVTISGSGNVVTDVTQNTNGITVTKGTITDTVTTIGANNANYTSGAINFVGINGIGIGKSGNTVTISASGGGGGIQNIRSDNSSYPGPAYNTDVTIQSHENWGLPQALYVSPDFAGNAIFEAEPDTIRAYASYDSVATFIAYSDVHIIPKNHCVHHYIVHMRGNSLRCRINDGVYTGDRLHVVGQSVNTPYTVDGNVLYSNGVTGVFESVGSASFMWDPKLGMWVQTSV